jgi:signal transduction histidine kinase
MSLRGSEVLRLRTQMGGVALLLGISTLLVLATGAPIAVWAPVAAIAFDTATVVALASIAAMIWVRYREHGPRRTLYQGSAFAVLGVGSLVVLAVMVLGAGGGPDELLDLWISVVWMVAGALLILSASPTADDTRPGRIPPRAIALGPALGAALLALPLIVAAAAEAASPLVRPSEVPGLGASADTDPAHLIGRLTALALLAMAAVRYERLYATTPSPSGAWLAVGLVWAAGAQLLGSLHAVHVPAMVTGADLAVAAFIGCAMAGVVAASRNNLRSLRSAYEELRVAREEELRRVAFAERARLARDIHDHLIQSLWLARLRQGHVLATDLSPESRELAEEVARALDDGLADAREAMVALDTGPEGPRPLHVVMQEGLARLIDRHDLELRMFRSGPMPALDPTLASQLLGIVREAITNSAKHADATMVRLRLIAREQELTVMVADNGNGFDPSTAPHGFGLESMQRRAAVIGATLAIDSRPLDGTRVTIQLPLGAEARA